MTPFELPPIIELDKEKDMSLEDSGPKQGEIDVQVSDKPSEPQVTPGAKADEEKIPTTGSTTAYGCTTRNYRGSKRPPDIPGAFWQTLSQKQRKEAHENFLKTGFGWSPKDSGTMSPMPKGSTPSESSSPFQSRVPTMPTLNIMVNEKHRTLIPDVDMSIWNPCVARTVTKKEAAVTPAAQAAMDKEWNKLEKQVAWDKTQVREWRDVCAEAKAKHKMVHVGRVFGILVEKGSELPANHPERKFKGRVVFQGNNVRDQTGDWALFEELSSAPATMEAGKAVDAYGCVKGNVCQQADGTSAYTQALLGGIPTWVRLPQDRWPREWIGKYTDPVCPLRLALYGHPDAGGYWEKHCEKHIISIGFQTIKDWRSVYWHPDLKTLLIVYVDDFKMSGPKSSVAKAWLIPAPRAVISP